MKKVCNYSLAVVLIVSILVSCCFGIPVFAGTSSEISGVLNPQNYTLYGNGDEFCTYNSSTESLDVMAHTAYKNGFNMRADTELKVNISVNSVHGKWMGIGFLGGANYGAPSSPDDGVMLYITADDTDSFYIFRIFRMNPLSEMTGFVTNIPVNTEFELSLKYDEQAKGWYYYTNGVKVDAGQAYFKGEEFIDENNNTYLNFAYENNNNTPIKVYSFTANQLGTGESTKIYTVDPDALNAENYNLYGNGDQFCAYDSTTKSLNIMAHGSYKNGFKLDSDSEIKVELSINSVLGKWLGIGFLGGANYGAPASPDDGVMLYITTDSSGQYYGLRIFQMNPFVEKTSYLTNIPIGSKFDLSLKRDLGSGNWYYYVNGTKVNSGEAYFEGENFIDANGYTYLNFAYENANNTPIKIYAVSTINSIEKEPVISFTVNEEALNPENYLLFGNGDQYCEFDSTDGSLNVMAHTAYRNGLMLTPDRQIKMELSIDSVSTNWLGIGFLGGANFGAPSTTDDGVMLYITADSSGQYYAFRIFQTNPFVEKTSYFSDIPVGTKFELSLKYDKESENWYYYANGVKIDMGEAYFSGENFIDANGITYLNFAYENYNYTPIKLYSVAYGRPEGDVIYEDVNGDEMVDVRDLVRMKKVMAGAATFVFADINGDGTFDARDMILLRRAILVQKTPYPLDRYSLQAYSLPYWDGNTVYQESVMALADENNVVGDIQLLYDATDIISVRSSDLKTEYREGIDYTLSNGKLHILDGSLIPVISHQTYYPNVASGSTFPLNSNYGSGYIYYSESEMHGMQIAVTYKHSDVWTGDVLLCKSSQLTNFMQKLSAGEEVTVVLYGDSICTGANSSAYINEAPYAPSWYKMFIDSLSLKFPAAKINFVNNSVGGMCSDWGVENASNRAGQYNPDLAIIGFGMNDGTKNVSADVFKSNISQIVSTIKADSADCEFILMSSILPNKEVATFMGTQKTYVPALATLEQSGVVFADITSVHETLLAKKRYCDMTGNNVNHPNDFLARLYLQVLYQTVIGY